MVLAVPAAGDAAQEPDGVRVAGILEDLGSRAFLHHLAGVHDPDAVAHLGDDGEVVADEEDRGAQLLSQRGDEIEHLGLDGGVERRRGLVEDEERRVGGERHGDDDALQHAAGELVGVGAKDSARVGDLHAAKGLDRALLELVAPVARQREDLADLAADADRRVQGPPRLLVHHGDGADAQAPELLLAHGAEVLAVDGDGAAAEASVAGQVAGDGEGGRRLAAAGLAHDAEGLLAPDAERHVAERQLVASSHAVGDVEVGDLEGRDARVQVGHEW